MDPGTHNVEHSWCCSNAASSYYRQDEQGLEMATWVGGSNDCDVWGKQGHNRQGKIVGGPVTGACLLRYRGLMVLQALILRLLIQGTLMALLVCSLNAHSWEKACTFRHGW